jgi:uncharacterized protein (DUF1330 family)
MSAYLVFIRERTLDAAELEIYWSEIRSTFVGHEVKVLASYGSHEDLEGPATEGTVIAEFPSIEAAKHCTTARHTRRYASIGRKAQSIAGFSFRGCDGCPRRTPAAVQASFISMMEKISRSSFGPLRSGQFP